MDSLTAFGLFAVTMMLVAYALEGRGRVGALVFAFAGALGGVAIKKSKQNAADERYASEVAIWEQKKAAFDTALAVCLDAA